MRGEHVSIALCKLPQNLPIGANPSLPKCLKLLRQCLNFISPYKCGLLRKLLYKAFLLVVMEGVFVCHPRLYYKMSSSCSNNNNNIVMFSLTFHSILQINAMHD